MNKHFFCNERSDFCNESTDFCNEQNLLQKKVSLSFLFIFDY